MYAVVRYNDYRKEEHFEIIATTTDVEYAKKIAFNKIKERLNKIKERPPEPKNDDEFYKISDHIETEYFQPINEEIISYRIIKVKKYKNKLLKLYHYTTKYAVVEFAVENTENLNEIDSSLICDNYIIDEDQADEDYEDAEEEARHKAEEDARLKAE
jgi:hypothetical protein